LGYSSLRCRMTVSTGATFMIDFRPPSQPAAIAAVITVFTIVSAHPAAESRQLSCTGSMIEPRAYAASPKSVKLTLGPAQNVGLDLGQGSSNVRVLSNNKIQLKFEAKDFTGEFFHYTGDLFLIYTSGHLARLTCTPA
jgi:hypothetical protein